MPAYINSIATAVPGSGIAQQHIANFMCRAMDFTETESRRLQILYKKTDIQYRHSVITDYGNSVEDYNFYPKNKALEPFPSVAERMQLYQKEAPKLAAKAATECIKKINPVKISHVLTVSCTGMYAPGLDIELIHLLGLPTHTKRTAINFMGCYGVFNALKVAKSICESDKDACVLLVSVELCTLHFQKENTESNLLSNALFADGVAAALIEASPRTHTPSYKIEASFCDLFPEAAEDMAWKIGNNGFEMVLSSKIPKYIQAKVLESIESLLFQTSIKQENLIHYAIHPGGKAIIEAVANALGLSSAQTEISKDILANYGNMSSATILFVLEKLLYRADKTAGPTLAMAFGPGLTLELMLLNKHIN